jgi:hypothetical protein
MPYKCNGCKKVSRGKQKRSITTMLNKHRCPGCGSTDFSTLDLVSNIFYDFEELVFIRPIESTSQEEQRSFLSFFEEKKISNLVPDYPQYATEPTNEVPDTNRHYSFSSDSATSTHDSHSHFSHDSDTSDCGGCDCGGGD